MSVYETDAVPRYPKEITCLRLPCQQNENEIPCLESLLNKLSMEEFKSLFFLLLKKYIKYDDYLDYVKRDKIFLKQKFIQLCETNKFNDDVLIELFGTLKNYEILDKLGTCKHIFEDNVGKFCNISRFWKFLYRLCEEIEEFEVVDLKEKLIQNSCNEELDSMEEVLCFSLFKGIFHEADISRLKTAFRHKPDCLSLIHKFDDELTYYNIRTPTQSQHCGIAVIINHEDFYKENENSPNLSKREGSQIDVEKLEKLWKQFGFETKVYNQMLTDKAVLELFKDLSIQDHSNYDAFVVCYLSHGHENVLYASNSKAIPIRDLECVMANECVTLFKKPKLFFIQACQGEEIQQGLRTKAHLPPSFQITNVQTDSPSVHKRCNEVSTDIPYFSDLLTVVSAYPGFVSYRSPSEGSWFISSLVEIMQSCGDNLPMTSVIQKVTNDVSRKSACISPSLRNCKQIVQFHSTLRYSLKLKKIQM